MHQSVLAARARACMVWVRRALQAGQSVLADGAGVGRASAGDRVVVVSGHWCLVGAG